MKITEVLKTKFTPPIKGIKDMPKVGFSSLIKKIGTSDLEKIYESEEYKKLEETGVILGFLEEREYNGMNWGLHMGMDVFIRAGVPVHCIFDGKVVYLQRYSNETNDHARVSPESHPDAWGNFIIIQHELKIEEKKVIVYSSYAHMKKIPDHIQIGTVLKKGEQISETGGSFTLENGGWPAHLHIQIALTRSLLAHGYTNDPDIEEDGLINPEEIFL
jgi:murein DD-endopeptidase MepM/ murein hydrolase activator NlpD